MTRRSVKVLAVLACALACAAALGCARKEAAQKPPEAGDTAVAKVGDQTIWASDVKREAVAEGLIDEGEPLDISSALFSQALDEVIDIKVLAAEAQRRKLDQSPAAQRRLAAAHDRIMQSLLLESVLEKTITPRSTQGLYEEQVKLTSGQMQYRARQIVVATPAEAEEVRRQAAQKNADFGALAAARSIDPATRFGGGDLGFFTTDVMPEPYAAALKDAKVGDLVGPFRTEAGYVLMKVDEVRPEPPIDLDAAKPQIIRFQTYAVVKDVIDDLRKDAKIKILVQSPKSAPGAPREPASAPSPAPAPASNSLRPTQ
jgi:peptidyl-prolyl cis-trans isomerase C